MIDNNFFYYFYLHFEKYSYDILESLTSIMIKMKLKNNFIITVISELSEEYIVNEKEYQRLMHEVINEIQLYKKLSNQC